MKLTTVVLLFAAGLSAQDQPANPLMGTSKAMFGISKGYILGSVDKIPENLWSFQPTKDVRTVGQLCAHIRREFVLPSGDGNHFMSQTVQQRAQGRKLTETLLTIQEKGQNFHWLAA